MSDLTEKAFWIRNDSWQQKMLLFFFLREKAKNNSVGAFYSESFVGSQGVSEEMVDFLKMTEATRTAIQKKIQTYHQKQEHKAVSINSGVYQWVQNAKEAWCSDRETISQEEWTRLQDWLKKNELDEVDIDDWENGLPTTSQILGFELRVFMEHFGEDFPDESYCEDNEGRVDEDIWDDTKWTYEGLLKGYLKDLRKSILLASSPDIFWNLLWDIWMLESRGLDGSNIEFFLKVADKKGIRNIYLSNPSIVLFLKAVNFLRQSPQKHSLHIYSEQDDLKQMLYVTRQLAWENLSCFLSLEEDLANVEKKALWSAFPLGKVNESVIKIFESRSGSFTGDIVSRINKYDLVCHYCSDGTQSMNRRLCESLVARTGLQWIISSFPHRVDSIESYWRYQHDACGQWLFFSKDYSGDRINFFNITSWEGEHIKFNPNDAGRLYGLLERWDFMPEKWSCEDDFLDPKDWDCFSACKAGVVFDSYSFCRELTQGRIVDNILISQIGEDWKHSSAQKIQAVLDKTANVPGLFSQVFLDIDPQYLLGWQKEVLRDFLEKGVPEMELSPETLRDLNWAALSYFYPAGILAADFRWRFLPVSKKVILQHEAVLKQQYWQAEFNRNFSAPGSRAANSQVLGNMADLMFLPKMPLKTSQDPGVPVISTKVLRNDCWGIDFLKVSDFTKREDLSVERIISEPVVLGFFGHRSFPVWFEYFDPETSPYKEICISEQVMIIKPKKGVSASGMWDSLIEKVCLADTFNTGDNWWVFSELTNPDAWCQELLAIDELGNCQVPCEAGDGWSGECIHYYAHFEQRQDLIASFLNKFWIKDRLDDTFEHYKKFLMEALAGKPNAFLPKAVTISFDSDAIKSIDCGSARERRSYRILSKDQAQLFIWNEDNQNPQIKGVVLLEYDGIGIRVADVRNYAALATLVYRSWQKMFEAMLSFAASLVAHEIKTVNQIIPPRMERLGLKLAGDAKAQEDVKEVVDSWQRLNNIAVKLSDFENAKGLESISEIDIGALIKNYYPSATISLAGSSLIKSYQFPIEMVIKNFIDNAIKYSPDQHCDISIANLDSGKINLVISNKTTSLFDSEHVLSRFGHKRFKSKSGGWGAWLACRMINLIGGSWSVLHKDGQFSVSISLKEAHGAN